MPTFLPLFLGHLPLRQTTEFCHIVERDPGGGWPTWVRPRQHGPFQMGAKNVAAVALRERHRRPGVSSVLSNAGGYCLLTYLADFSSSPSSNPLGIGLRNDQLVNLSTTNCTWWNISTKCLHQLVSTFSGTKGGSVFWFWGRDLEYTAEAERANTSFFRNDQMIDKNSTTDEGVGSSSEVKRVKCGNLCSGVTAKKRIFVFASSLVERRICVFLYKTLCFWP